MLSSSSATAAGGRRLTTKYGSDGDLKVIVDRPLSKKIVSSAATSVRLGLVLSRASVNIGRAYNGEVLTPASLFDDYHSGL